MAVIVRDCPHCGAGYSSLTFLSTAAMPGSEAEFRALLACNRCHGPFAGVTRPAPDRHVAITDPLKVMGDVEAAGLRVIFLQPKQVKPTAPLHTPDFIGKRFLEAEDSFLRRKWTSAVGMYRSTLDLATKDIATNSLPSAVGLKLAARIEALAGQNIITKAMRDWGHQIRGAGNDALHDEKEMSEVDAVQMRLFTETFLQYAYELPGEVEERRAQTKAAS